MQWLSPALCRLVLFLLATIALSAAAFAVDRNAWTFTSYDLRVRIDRAQSAMDVTGTVELRNSSQQPQRQVPMQVSSSFEWRAITRAGERVPWIAQPYTSDIDHTGALSEAIVNLAEAVTPGGTVKLDVHYSGVITRDATRLTRIGTPEQVATRSDWDQIGNDFTAVRGLGYVTWYPVAMDAASLSNGSEVWDTIAAWRQRHNETRLNFVLRDGTSDVVELNSPTYGDCRGENEVADTPKGTRCTSGYIILTDTPVFVIGDLRPLNRQLDTVMATAAHASLAKDYALAVENAMNVMADWFGRSSLKVEIVELTDPDALPFEAGIYLYTPLKPTRPAALEVALARTAAHAFFSSPRAWIREGLATFAQALVREQQQGRKAALAYLNQFVNALAAAEEQVKASSAAAPASGAKADAPQLSPQPLVTTHDELFYRTKAAFVWWMLRDMVGDDAIKTAISRYRAAEDREPSYMQRLLENAGTQKHDLEAFFDSWVYRDRGLPDLAVVSAYPRQTLTAKADTPATYVVAVTVENRGDAWVEAPIAVRSDKGERTARVAVPPHEKAIARVAIASKPTEVVVNDGSVPEAEITNNRLTIAENSTSR